MRPEDSALSVQAGVQQPPNINANFKPVRRARRLSAEAYAEGIVDGDRILLSRAITLIESERREDQNLAREIVDLCLPRSGKSIRVGITGVPGVGKSSFIEALGGTLTAKGHKLAVLAVDPSSQVSGGSILGDKSRMTTLASDPNAFVRPSPSRGSLGGVARKTRETILLCEAAGYDIVLVETVGVGQSETVVHSMVDCFLLLMLAGAGDELQGVKRGIMEMAHLLAITKADGDNLVHARVARQQYRNALHLFPPTKTGWRPPVVLSSSVNRGGVLDVWTEAERFIAHIKSCGWFEKKRSQQAIQWMQDAIRDTLMDEFTQDPDVVARLPLLREQVLEGKVSPQRAADLLLAAFKSDPE